MSCYNTLGLAGTVRRVSFRGSIILANCQFNLSVETLRKFLEEILKVKHLLTRLGRRLGNFGGRATIRNTYEYLKGA